jgi:GntR family transcriptional regulator/MocR family aminotransferase
MRYQSTPVKAHKRQQLAQWTGNGCGRPPQPQLFKVAFGSNMKNSSLPFDNVAVDRSSKVPVQRQLYVTIRSDILTGRLPSGFALPPTRSLARRLGIGRNTVLATYDQLLAEGLVEARQGSGTWVAPLERVVTAEPTSTTDPLGLSRRGEIIASRPQPAATAGKINLQPGFPESETFPFETWARILARNARRRREDLLEYLDYAGHPDLRDTIAKYVGAARGVICGAEQVIVVTGAQAALDLVSRILMDSGDCVWMEEPGYLGARAAFLGAGANLAAVRVSREGWRFGDPELAPPRLIYVTPSCQWPRGTVMRMEERLQLLGLADRHNAWIIEDDYDGEYRFRGQPIPAMRALSSSDRVIYVGTFGKTLFSSLRIGFLVVPRQLAAAFSRAISVTGQFAPLPLQLALADFIREGYFARHLRRMRRLYARRQKRFVELCERHLSRWLTVAENDAGMQILGRLTAFDDRAVVSAALRHGLDLQPISINFHVDQPEHGLLLGFAQHNERRALRAVLALKATLAELEASG